MLVLSGMWVKFDCFRMNNVWYYVKVKGLNIDLEIVIDLEMDISV